MLVLPSSCYEFLLRNTNIEALEDKAMQVCKYNPSNSKLHSGAAIITTVRTVEVLQYASFEGEFGHIADWINILI